METRAAHRGIEGRKSRRASQFRTDIQGLRAIAVLAVVLYHAGIPFLSGGYVGVDVFFVISGYLITTHLLEGLERDGQIRFASFYAKRARRILPAAFIVLILTVVSALIWMPPLLMQELWRGAVATALYVPNVLFAIEGTNDLAEEAPSMFQQYWSLGIEEQFYLVWRLLLDLKWRWARSKRTLLMMLLALVTISFVACIALSFWMQPWTFFLLPTRAWELGVGGIVAFLVLRRPSLIPVRLASGAGWVGILLMVAPMTVPPTRLVTGIDSPVSIDSSTADSPSMISPSTGILFPGRKMTTSPTTTSAVGSSISLPSRSTVALGGARSRSALRAADAPARARISSQCPSRMKTRRTAEAS